MTSGARPTSDGNGRLLARIDERTASILREVAQLRADLAAHKAEARGTYVTRAEFRPIRSVIYGLVGLTLTSVGGGVLALVLR
ncbi:MAG: hypothetical protein OXG33_03395 [Chloroflexi bacterium]|nr:hypothetical protein [Chloroflexota bacterium]